VTPVLLVQPANLPFASKPFLRFETLTLAPFDRRLLNPALMTEQERTWLDTYHARVLEAVGPALGDTERAWLTEACAPLAV
jgi:Xaa-Pro aminopeptidase